MSDSKIVLGVDIGGTHITCAKVDLEKETIVGGTKTTANVNSSGGPDEILDVWKAVIKESMASNPTPVGIGVAMPGPFDYEKGISKIKGVGKYESLYDLNIKEIFSSTSSIPVDNIKFLNDASCFALGEYFAGAGKGFKKIIAITLGTGFGSSIVVDGKIVTKGVGVPEGGMFWNQPFKNGIADDYFSTRWFEESYYKKSGTEKKGVYEIVQAVETDENARKVFEESTLNLIEFLVPWIEKFKPDLLVAGGSISKSHYLFLPRLQKEIFIKKINTEIRISELWEDAAVIGSANLFKD